MRKGKWFWVGVVSLLFCFFASFGSSTQGASVQVLTLQGQLDGSQVSLLQRGLKKAAKQGDKAVVLNLALQGDDIRAAQTLNSIIRASSVPTIAYVTMDAGSRMNTIAALSCRHIVMSPQSRLGGAKQDSLEDATRPQWNELAQELATLTGRNAQVAMALVDNQVAYPPYSAQGMFLRLTADQAKTLSISEGTAKTLVDALHLFSLDNLPVYYETQTWSDRLSGVLQNDYIHVIIVALIALTILVEIKMAGIGIGVITAIVIGGILFCFGVEPEYADIRTFMAFVVGIVCLMLELVIPGVGIFGVMGICLLYGSLFFFFGATVYAIYILAIGSVVAAVLFYIILRRLPKTSITAELILHEREFGDVEYATNVDNHRYLGMTGISVTTLKPVGMIKINGELLEAVTRTMVIEKKRPVRVIRLEGNRLVVAEII